MNEVKIGKFEKYQAQPPETVPLPPEYYEDNGETAVYWLSSAGVLINSHGVNIMIDPALYSPRCIDLIRNGVSGYAMGLLWELSKKSLKLFSVLL